MTTSKDREIAAGRRPDLNVGRAAQWGWGFYDFANSSFTTVILTFVFANYFAKAVAPNETLGTAWWGWTLGIAQVVIALLSPVLGAVADHTGRRKPWILFFSLLCILASFALWWVLPAQLLGMAADPQRTIMLWTLVAVVLGSVGFEMALVFYNAMLPDLAPREQLGRLSGYAWGFGYVGGLLSLVLCLAVINLAPFGLDSALQEPVRATSLLVAVWFALFLLPFWLLVPDRPRSQLSYAAAISRGLRELVQTLRSARSRPDLFRFLIAHLFYRDGLNTLLTMGGLFAGVAYGLSFQELLLFGILLNVTAALGSVLFGWLDDRLGSRRSLILSLVLLCLVAVPLLAFSAKLAFFLLAGVLGLFVGSIQSSSRTMIARFAAPGEEAELYGLFAFSGKSTSFIGPFMVAQVTLWTGSPRWGMATLLLLLGIGLLLLLGMREPDQATARQS